MIKFFLIFLLFHYIGLASIHQVKACSTIDYEASSPPQVCGNGIAEGTEECDDGNTLDGDSCSSTCTLTGVPPSAFPPTCGDGVVEDSEECDDGNTLDGDGCSSICAIETFSTSDMPGSCTCGDPNHPTCGERCPLEHMDDPGDPRSCIEECEELFLEGCG